MSFQGQPTVAGTYRVKQYNGNGYWKYISDGTRWIQLDSLDESSDLFKWNIAPVSSGYLNVFTISPASDTSVGFFYSAANESKYGGYGFAKGRQGLSDNWRFKESADGKYSSINVDGLDYVLDSRNNPERCVHFYEDQDADSQHFVVQLIESSPLSKYPSRYLKNKEFPYLDRRAVVPVKKVRLGQSLVTAPDGNNLPDLNNVQGDVYYMFPKNWERFVFFKISDLTQFRKDLDTFAPIITSSTQTAQDLEKIHVKEEKDLDIVSHGIAFSKAGVKKLGENAKLGDPHFDQGSLVNEKKQLGDMSDYDAVFATNGNTHGVILVTAGQQDTCKKKTEYVTGTIFKNSINVVTFYEGRVRPGEGEHFGWRDGISQPALKGIGESKPGQRVVRPGVIILGFPGDPVVENKNLPVRPSFTKNGSFMVFRKLEQNVLVLEDYIAKYWKTIPRDIAGNSSILLDDNERKQLFAARLVGRFMSGVPLALSPYTEDRDFLSPAKINNFDYTEIDGRCPFASHIRKIAPRKLTPFVTKDFLDASVMVRSAIPYGPEITQADRDKWKTLTDDQKWTDPIAKARGLLFVCYQSAISNGFFRQTTGFANNDFFPIISLVPQKTGQDPIIGGPKPVTAVETQVVPNVANQEDVSQDGEVSLELTNSKGDKYAVDGIAKKIVPPKSFVQEFFVTSRGGEYYFVPSIDTVKSWGAKAQNNKK